MEWIPILIGTIFTILGLLSTYSLVMGLPGIWMIIGLAGIVELTDHFYRGLEHQTFNGWIFILGIAFALLAEALELIFSLFGAKKAGSSKEGMKGAFIGGIIGAFAGMLIPIPIIGSVSGALLGTFLGAIHGEIKNQEERQIRKTLKPATGATIGYILGTLAKLPLGITVWVMFSVAIFWP